MVTVQIRVQRPDCIRLCIQKVWPHETCFKEQQLHKERFSCLVEQQGMPSGCDMALPIMTLDCWQRRCKCTSHDVQSIKQGPSCILDQGWPAENQTLLLMSGSCSSMKGRIEWQSHSLLIVCEKGSPWRTLSCRTGAGLSSPSLTSKPTS